MRYVVSKDGYEFAIVPATSAEKAIELAKRYASPIYGPWNGVKLKARVLKVSKK